MAAGVCQSGQPAIPGSKSGSKGRVQKPGLEAASGRRGSGGSEKAGYSPPEHLASLL